MVTDDDIPIATPAGDALAESIARAKAAFDAREHERAARAAWEATPEGRAELAAQADRDRAERLERRTASLLARAAEVGLPDHPDLRRIACDATATLRETEALAAIRTALVWRETTRSRFGTAPLLRVVMGPVGTGKSCAMAHVLVRHPRSAAWVNATTLGTTPRNGWSDNERAWAQWLKVDLLGVDEVGIERGDVSALPALIVERHNAGLATVLVGNLAPAEWAKRYGDDERLRDRMRAQPIPAWVTVSGTSMRGQEVNAG